MVVSYIVKRPVLNPQFVSKLLITSSTKFRKVFSNAQTRSAEKKTSKVSEILRISCFNPIFSIKKMKIDVWRVIPPDAKLSRPRNFTSLGSFFSLAALVPFIDLVARDVSPSYKEHITPLTGQNTDLSPENNISKAGWCSTLTSCSFARHEVGKMGIHCSFAHH